MGTEPLERKLAAILYADVAGYSRLTGEDEEGTHRALRSYLDLISSSIRDHSGRVVHYAGDAVLADFGTVVDALICAAAIQCDLAARDSGTPKQRKVQFRIGVNLGDVIVDRDEIYGDGVNVAARLESLAEPGGICISESVRTAIGNKLSFDYEFMGEQQVKNIKEAVRAYKVVMANEQLQEVVSPEKPALELLDQPSIAVLPFSNMSGDPEQEYFSDGITDDIITALSKVSNMLVVASNSTFTYKGKAVDVKQVSREQGVRYVLEGSVRKATNRVRVNAQLIDATSGHHLWAERYDRALEDIFAVQDEITREIVVSLDVHLREGEQARFWSSGTKNVEAWECVRLGSELLNRHRAEDLPGARRLLKRAIDIDPDYAVAWVWLGWSHYHEADDPSQWDSQETREKALRSTHECARHALQLDPSCADAYSELALYHLSVEEHAEAVLNVDKSVALAPNHAFIIAASAAVLNKCGQPKKSIERIRKAMRLCPIYPAWFLYVLGTACRLTGNNDEAISAYAEHVKREPEALAPQVCLASTLGEVSREAEARTRATEILRIDPDFSIRKYMQGLAYSDPAEAARFEDGLRKAGLPE